VRCSTIVLTKLLPFLDIVIDFRVRESGRGLGQQDAEDESKSDGDQPPRRSFDRS
jgi:hypothetical protein